MDTQDFRFVFLPYIRTSFSDRPPFDCPQRTTIRGIDFRSTLDTADLSPENRSHVATIKRMFYAWGGEPIGDMLFATIPESDLRQPNVLQRTSEALLLLSYMYTVPHRTGGTFLTYDQCAFYLFRPGKNFFVFCLTTSTRIRHFRN